MSFSVPDWVRRLRSAEYKLLNQLPCLLDLKSRKPITCDSGADRDHESLSRPGSIVVAGTGSFLSCTGPEESARSSGKKPSSELRFDGTVQYRELEGGTWVIVSEAGKTYDPVGLPEKYREEGLMVRVWANRVERMAGTRMVGPIISIQHVERR